MDRIHATSVAIDGTAVLIRGPSGSGKSDLALRLMDKGAELIADDYTEVLHDGEALIARVPEPVAGVMEVRGLGVIRVDYCGEAPVGLVVELTSRKDIDRLPDPETCRDYGPPLMLVRLDPFDASTTAKVRLAVRMASGNNIRAD